ncbi:type IV toxin-antitoxin system AbiEi family antitoxin domain-containing protein [Candidatus Neptunochlamydia vexilliferae]|nr:type IV toxin-antitoxin system AbiEi family antitoxin domain-containing protein [Candidatus Neptunochlamydia vexilliferae]
MERDNQLFEIADRQQGYFTAKQAEACGYARSNFHLRLSSGEWLQEGRGIYRLGRYPVTDRPELVLWSLWSRNRKDDPQGVWSHETALDIHELSDVMPAKMHMTVPPNFRRRVEIPNLLYLHRGILEKSDVEERQGYKVTTPLKTLMDVIDAGTVADNFIFQAAHQAIERGMILKKEVNALQSSYPNIYKKLERIFDDTL